ncbi:hypothetical protein ABZX69_33055 [Streptomyces sp. NPDC004074]|uniref:hypothetical protein n=1 Tax=Streptomyces sp. NPDC004074 TaxID=3154277 RepID=UPI00339DECB5
MTTPVTDFQMLAEQWLQAPGPEAAGGRPGGHAWAALTAALAELAPADRRPDLYRDGMLDTTAIAAVTGLGHLARAAAAGTTVPAADLAADLADFAARNQPVIETWILLNADLPAGTDITLGTYRLTVPGRAAAQALVALPRLARHLPAPAIDPALLAGSAFLRTPAPQGRKYGRGALYFADLDRRPERPHADVLLALQMWDLSASLHPEAYYHVEAGRHVRSTWGGPTIEPAFDHLGQEVGELHRRHGPYVTPAELPAFTHFCTSVHTMITAVRSRTTTSSPSRPTPTAVALDSASRRLLRASQRTFGGDFVDEADAEDVLLDYVVAIESLLASDGRSDKRRTTRQRAAALHTSDQTRLNVSATVGRAYTQRSRYAHGEPQSPLSNSDITAVRNVAFSVFLRWLITTTNCGEQVLKQLDDSLLSAQARTDITTAVEQYLAAHPAPPAS